MEKILGHRCKKPGVGAGVGNKGWILLECNVTNSLARKTGEIVLKSGKWPTRAGDGTWSWGGGTGGGDGGGQRWGPR